MWGTETENRRGFHTLMEKERGVLMLPHEQDVQQIINEDLSTELALANQLLDFGINLPASKDLHQGGFPRDSVITVVGLFTKATITFRAIIGLCELGLDRTALPLTRSLFENLLYLTFLLRRRVRLYEFKNG